MSRQEKVYTFNEYVLGYDSGEDGSCLTISKVLNGETYVMSQLYKSNAIVVSIVLDVLQKGLQEKDKEIERLNNKEEQLIRKLEDLIIIGEQVENGWAVDICKMIIEELKGEDEE